MISFSTLFVYETFARCPMKNEIRSIHDSDLLLNKVSYWSKNKQLNANCYFEIGKSSFFLFVKTGQSDLLKNALNCLDFSTKNLSYNDSIYQQCDILNAYVSYLFQFKPDFSQRGYDPVMYLNNELKNDCIHYQISTEKKLLLKQTNIMKQYFQTEMILKTNPNKKRFENMLKILNDIEQMGILNVNKLRDAYHAWQQYFSQLTQIHKEPLIDCHAFVLPLKALYQAKKSLSFVKDNRNACKSYVNCQFNACLNEMKTKITQNNVKHFRYDGYLKKWRNNFNLAILKCEENKVYPVDEIDQYLHLTQNVIQSADHMKEKDE